MSTHASQRHVHVLHLHSPGVSWHTEQQFLIHPTVSPKSASSFLSSNTCCCMAAYSCCAYHSTKIEKAALHVAARPVSARVVACRLYEARVILFFLRGEYMSVPATHKTIRPSHEKLQQGSGLYTRTLTSCPFFYDTTGLLNQKKTCSFHIATQTDIVDFWRAHTRPPLHAKALQGPRPQAKACYPLSIQTV